MQYIQYSGKERRKNISISKEDFDAVVEDAAMRAKELAKQELLVEIGKSTLSKMRWVLYVGFGALAAWLASHGFFVKSG